MSEAAPIQVATEETVTWLASVLPRPPAKVIEVGAGSGVVADELARRGWRVTALDRAPSTLAEIRAASRCVIVTGDFFAYGGGPFDAVVFTRSLHHLHPLDRALEGASSHMPLGGLVVAEEFAWEKMDGATARWLELRTQELVAEGVLAADDEPKPAIEAEEDDPLRRWRAYHEVEHDVYPGEAMLVAARERFEPLSSETGPYLYRSLCRRLENSPRGVEIGRQLLAEEAAAIAAGQIRAIGLRFVMRLSHRR